jgi:serine/threonine protein kinase
MRVGTVNYMAPEQLEGSDAGPPADLRDLGVTLYAATEGRPPFDGPTLAAIMAGILTRAPALPQHAGPLGELIGALLAKDPADRPVAQAVISALAEATASPAPEPRELAAVTPSAAADALPGHRDGIQRRRRRASFRMPRHGSCQAIRRCSQPAARCRRAPSRSRKPCSGRLAIRVEPTTDQTAWP